MKTEVFADADTVAQAAVSFIVAKARAAFAARGRFILVVWSLGIQVYACHKAFC